MIHLSVMTHSHLVVVAAAAPLEQVQSLGAPPSGSLTPIRARQRRQTDGQAITINHRSQFNFVSLLVSAPHSSAFGRFTLAHQWIDDRRAARQIVMPVYGGPCKLFANTQHTRPLDGVLAASSVIVS